MAITSTPPIVDPKKQKVDNDSKVAAINAKKENAQEVSSQVQYTLFASGLNYGGRNIELKDKNYNDDLAIIFDVVDQHSYTRTVDKSSFSVESKVKYSDHGVVEDGKFSFSARVNSSPTSLIENNYLDKDTDKNNPVASRRPQRALEILERILEERQLITLITEDNILDSYIITSLEASRSSGDGAALVFSIECQEFRQFMLGKTVIGTNFVDPKKGKKKQKGAVNSSATAEDIEFYERKSLFRSDIGKRGLEPVFERLGVDYKQDAVAGVIKPDGTRVLTDGKIIKP